MGKLMLNSRSYTGGGQGNTNYVGSVNPPIGTGGEHDAYYKIQQTPHVVNYVKFSIIETRVPNSWVSLSKLYLSDITGDFYDWDGATITCTEQVSNAEDLLDDNIATTVTVESSAPVEFTIHLPEPLDTSYYTSWGWYTGDQSTDYDPTTFALSFSADGINWELADMYSSSNITTERQTQAYGHNFSVLADKSITDRYLKVDGSWVKDTNGGGGAGGHTIVDENGTSYAQEPNLQFVGTKVSDDSANNKTVVTVFEHKTKAQWEAMTPQEQADGNFIVSGMGATGDLKNNYVSFTSGDSADADATSWTSVQPMANTDIFSVLFNKISTMAKNVRFLYKTQVLYETSNYKVVRCGRLVTVVVYNYLGNTYINDMPRPAGGLNATSPLFIGNTIVGSIGATTDGRIQVYADGSNGFGTLTYITND
jgi:hypothetical protein